MSEEKRKGESDDMGKGQMWSVDVIIGIVIFISIITVFYTTLSDSGQNVRQRLEANADTVLTKFNQDPELRVIEGNNVLNTTRLEELAKKNYTALKESLGIESDFCIYVKDSKGRIVPLNNKTSFGKDEINISGKECGSKVA